MDSKKQQQGHAVNSVHREREAALSEIARTVLRHGKARARPPSKYALAAMANMFSYDQTVTVGELVENAVLYGYAMCLRSRKEFELLDADERGRAI